MKNIRYTGFLLFSILLCFVYNTSRAQLVAYADSIGCASTSTTLHGVLNGNVPIDAGINEDDVWSDLIPIGFTFNFYGVDYTQCIIGANGELGFEASNAGSYNTWEIDNTLATGVSAAPDVINCICGPWCDIDAYDYGGTITYATSGVAPNRRFCVTYCATHMFDCTGQFLTTQIILYETTNIAEVHIAHHTVCTGWNNGAAIVGVINEAGTSSTVAPGRDYDVHWTVTDEAWRFTQDPGGATYAVSSIPFDPIPYATSSIYWYDSTTGALVGTGPDITVYPTVPTTYIAEALGCGDTSFAYVHANPISSSTSGSNLHITTSWHTNPTQCGLCDGTITLKGITPGQIDSLFYIYNGLPVGPIVTTAGTDSIIMMTGLCGGAYTDIYVKVGGCMSNPENETLITPTLTSGFIGVPHLGCTQDSVVITNLSTPPGFTSNWSFGDGTTDNVDANPVHVYTSQGNYTITLVYSNGYCYDTTVQAISIIHPLTSAFSVYAPAICLGTESVFTNSSVANRPSYLWNFGDGTVSNVYSPTHTYAAGGNYNVTLTVTDTVPNTATNNIYCPSTSSTNVEVIEVHVRTDFHDTIVCLRDSMPLITYMTVVPAVSNVTYAWLPTNNIGDATSPHPNFFGGGDYTYTVTVTTDPLGCTASDFLAIHAHPPVDITGVTASQTIANGSSVQLNAMGGEYYTWTPNNGTLDNPNINDPMATPTDSITNYVVHVMNQWGCLDSAVVTITLDYGGDVFIPMAFSPNNDGLNDKFRVTNIGQHKLVDMRIFDRWGHEVFQTSNPEKGWDGTLNGTPQDLGVYNYMIIIANPDGVNRTVAGTVTLVR